MGESEFLGGQIRCPQCDRLLGDLKAGQVVIRCGRCKVDCRARVEFVPKIVVEIVQSGCDTAPDPA
jgi:hypothetical protein